MTIRITGGEARGRGIPSPKSKAVRPTASKMRQALFNILSVKLHDAEFLDIFAGTGLIGIEALSRGASRLTAIEHNKSLASNIGEAITKLGYQAKVFAQDFRQGLANLEPQKFDIIFADPPYKTNFGQNVLALIKKYDLLKEDGIIVIEHLSNSRLDCSEVPFKQIDYRQYGQSAFSFFSF